MHTQLECHSSYVRVSTPEATCQNVLVSLRALQGGGAAAACRVHAAATATVSGPGRVIVGLDQAKRALYRSFSPTLSHSLSVDL